MRAHMAHARPFTPTLPYTRRQQPFTLWIAHSQLATAGAAVVVLSHDVASQLVGWSAGQRALLVVLQTHADALQCFVMKIYTRAPAAECRVVGPAVRTPNTHAAQLVEFSNHITYCSECQ